MPRSNKRYGVGAEVGVKTRFLHPNLYIKKIIGQENIPDNHSIHQATIKRLEVKYVRRKRQLCYVLTHPEFVDDDEQPAEIYIVRGNCSITKEGDPDLFFDRAEEERVEVTGVVITDEVLIPNEVRNFDHQDNIQLLVEQGIIEEQDDNHPIPDILPNVNSVNCELHDRVLTDQSFFHKTFQTKRI